MKSINLLIGVLVLFLVVSCGDEFLTKTPQAQFSTIGLQTPEGVEGILLGAYNMIDGNGLDGQAPWENDIHNWVFGGIASDNALKGTDAGDQPEQSFIEAYDFNSFNNHIKNKWRGVYKGVARANDAIVTANLVEALSAERKAQIIAEARFLRGVFHLEAQKMWKNPIYVDDSVYDINDVESTKVPNTGDIWANIEADFDAASQVLPNDQALVGRPTKLAAKAFLAKAKMYQGWDDAGNANTSKLAEAKAILDEILNSGKYSLMPKYSENFFVRTNNNVESIWEVQFAVSSASTDNGNTGIGLSHPYIAPWGCCGFYQAPQNLVNAFRTDDNGLPLLDTYNDVDIPSNSDEYTGPIDPRIDHTLGRPGILFKEFQLHGPDFIRDVSYAGVYSSMKHVGEPEAFGIGGWGNITANNYRIMRLSMVTLWLAEAEVELGNLERARELVNMIRTRAANAEDFVPKAIQGASRQAYTLGEGPAANYVIGTYDDAWTDQATARKAVRFETRLETAMEGHRFFDLQRWGVQAEVLNSYLDSESKHRVYLSGKTFVKGKNEFYPIPTEAIDRSSLDGSPTLTQDPAYN